MLKYKLNLLADPPIGGELPSDCLERCDTYDYILVNEDRDDTDEDTDGSDLYFYFASNEVETWRKAESFTGLTLISNIGGVMGLLLGASFLTIFAGLISLVDKYLLAMLKDNFKKKKRISK